MFHARFLADRTKYGMLKIGGTGWTDWRTDRRVQRLMQPPREDRIMKCGVCWTTECGVATIETYMLDETVISSRPS